MYRESRAPPAQGPGSLWEVGFLLPSTTVSEGKQMKRAWGTRVSRSTTVYQQMGVRLSLEAVGNVGPSSLCLRAKEN